MSVAVTFLHPALLGLGAALAAIPIVIHLLNRRQVRRVPWAAMHWLLAAIRRHQRRLRVENWLVLALRVAAVLLLALALSRPVVTDPTVAGLLGRARRCVYLVLDTSYSTGAKTTARSVADLVKSEADRVLGDLTDEDTVAVVLTNDPRTDLSDGLEPSVLLPRTAGREGGSRAKEALASLRLRDAPARWPEAMRLVQQQMAPEDVNRLVVAVTDLQATDWEPDRRGGRRDADALGERLSALLAAQAAVRVVDVGGTDRRNLGVAALAPRSGRDAFVGRPTSFDVTIANFGPREVRGAQVSLYVDGDATPARRVEVPPLPPAEPGSAEVGTREVVPVDLPPSAFRSPGSHWVRAAVTPPAADPDADALGADSQRLLVLRVRERVRVLAWARTSPRAATDAQTYLRGVYGGFAEMEGSGDAGPARVPPVFALETVDREADLAARLGGAAGARPDLVVLAGVAPRGPAAAALAEFVRDGGALLAFAGETVGDPAAWNEAFHGDPDARLLPFPVRRAETWDPVAAPQAAFRLDFDRPTGHPLAAPFLEESAAAFLREAPFDVRGRMPFDEKAAPRPPADGGAPAGGAPDGGGRVVLRFTDGEPAVVSGRLGLGRTVWVGTSVDDGWLDSPAPSFFLPVFLDEAAVWLTQPEGRGWNLEVGERLTAGLPRDATSPRVLSPGGGERVPTPRGGGRETDRPVVTLDGVGTAGLWRLTYAREGAPGAAAGEDLFAVNLDPSEGALAAARPERILERLPPEADLAVLTSWAEVREQAAEARQAEASRTLLWALLGVLALESLLAWAFGRQRSLASEESS